VVLVLPDHREILVPQSVRFRPCAQFSRWVSGTLESDGLAQMEDTAQIGLRGRYLFGQDRDWFELERLTLAWSNLRDMDNAMGQPLFLSGAEEEGRFWADVEVPRK